MSENPYEAPLARNNPSIKARDFHSGALLEPTEVVKIAFTVLTRNIGKILGLYFILAIPFLALIALGVGAYNAGGYTVESLLEELKGFADEPATWVMPLVAGYLILVIIAMILNGIQQTVIIKLTESHLFDSATKDLFSLISHSLPRVPAMIGAVIVKTFLVLIGYILCIIPGIFASIRLVFMNELVALKGQGPISSVTKSMELTQPKVSEVFVRGIIFYLLVFAPVFVLQIIMQVAMSIVGASSITPGEPDDPTQLFSRMMWVTIPVMFVVQLANILLQTLFQICWAVTYFNFESLEKPTTKLLTSVAE